MQLCSLFILLNGQKCLLLEIRLCSLTAKLFVEEIVSHHGVPSHLLSDCGAAFVFLFDDRNL